MKFLFWNLEAKKRPSRGQRISVLEVSLEEVSGTLAEVIEKLDAVARQTEATRKKVYRDETGAPDNGKEAAAVEVRPGDSPPPGWQ